MAAILVVTALVAAACGGESATVDTAAQASDAQTPAADEATQESEDAASDDSSSEGSTADQETSEAETPEAAGPDEDAEEAAEPEPVGDHEFPDLGTVNIADGSAVNLADQLAGGDTPVLLWFFAPH